jgi:hypothetical protein
VEAFRVYSKMSTYPIPPRLPMYSISGRDTERKMEPTANSNLIKKGGSMAVLYIAAAVSAAALLFPYLLV